MILTEIISKAQSISQQYYFLTKLIDWESIAEQLTKNLSLYSNDHKEKPLNILEALLRPSIGYASVYDPKINLLVLEEGLKTLYPILNENDKHCFSSKISNLSNTAFWDTAPEIWLAASLHKSGQKVILDFPLTKPKRGYTPPNADVAIVDVNKNVIWLIDVFSPVLDKERDYELILDESDGATYFGNYPEKAISWFADKLALKYKKKFSAFCESFPKAKIALFLSVTKSDMISIHFTRTRIPVIMHDERLMNCKNLTYAMAGRFQNNNGKLSLLKLAEFKAG
jgi:hypothetical protein